MRDYVSYWTGVTVNWTFVWHWLYEWSIITLWMWKIVKIGFTKSIKPRLHICLHQNTALRLDWRACIWRDCKSSSKINKRIEAGVGRNLKLSKIQLRNNRSIECRFLGALISFLARTETMIASTAATAAPAIARVASMVAPAAAKVGNLWQLRHCQAWKRELSMIVL